MNTQTLDEGHNPGLRQIVARIVSGGQTGVDRAALDWAIQNEVPHGGWCPSGRLAEDGTLDTLYDLKETLSDGYRQRTKQNVIDSDGTLILNVGELSDGTLATLKFTDKFEKPCLVIQLDGAGEADNVRLVIEWVRRHGIRILNLAGPRESKRPGIYQATLAFLDKLRT